MILLPALAALFFDPDSAGLPRKAAADVGMSAERLAAIDRIVTRGISAGAYSGAAVVVGRRGAAVWQKGFGHLDWGPRARAVDARSTLYDLASITKVAATTTAIMILVDRGRIRLDDPVGKYLPSFRKGEKSLVTVRHLLTHRSGLPSGRALWRKARTPAAARREVLATPLVYPPGSRHIYSDLGPDLLAMVVEAVSRERFDRFLAKRVYRPLGMRNTLFRPDRPARYRAAATEMHPPRGYPLRGEVHDENAYALGGVAGHAGLFSTAADLAVFAQMMLNGGSYKSVHVARDSTVALFVRRAVGWRALGWESCAGGGSCGQHLSERAYGHTGYTGTSIWIDPDRDMFVILLTNWVHGGRDRPVAAEAVLRDVRADVADAAALAIVDDPGGVAPMPTSFRADRAVGWH